MTPIRSRTRLRLGRTEQNAAQRSQGRVADRTRVGEFGASAGDVSDIYRLENVFFFVLIVPVQLPLRYSLLSDSPQLALLHGQEVVLVAHRARIREGRAAA